MTRFSAQRSCLAGTLTTPGCAAAQQPDAVAHRFRCAKEEKEKLAHPVRYLDTSPLAGSAPRGRGAR